MNRDAVLAHCLALPAAEETYPFGDEVAVIKVGGRMFALVSLGDEPVVNLKCDPSRALELREAYAGIRPGYHQDKRHWNSVDLDGSVEGEVVGVLDQATHEPGRGLLRPRGRQAPEGRPGDADPRRELTITRCRARAGRAGRSSRSPATPTTPGRSATRSGE
jgi:predicted DNA-binding protein (MmcQ/YjbR family)